MANVKGKDNYSVTPQVLGVDVSLVGHNHNHNILTNYIANQHIDHTTVRIIAGTGLAGGGDLTISRTLSLDVNGLLADGTPDGAADFLATYDASAVTHKKLLVNNRPGSASGTYVTQWTSFTPTTQGSWYTVTAAGVPANSRVDILAYNTANTSKLMGVRAVGSSLNRSTDIDKNSGTAFTVLLNGSSQYQQYTAQTSVTTFYIMGYRS